MGKEAPSAVGLQVQAAPTNSSTASKLGRFGPAYLIGQLSWAIPAAASATLLQALAAQVAPHDKIGFYTVLTAIGAVTSTVATIVGGLLSDRTRSNLGKRLPWIAAGSMISALSLTGVGLLAAPFAAVVFYALFQLGIGLTVASMNALLPDRVPESLTGRASSFGGFGNLLGQTAGGILAALFVVTPRVGLVIVPWTMVVGALIVVLALRGTERRDASAGVRSTLLRDLIPPRNADYWWAFAGRFLFILSVVSVTLYELYILTDAVGLPLASAGRVLTLASLVIAAAASIGAIVVGPISDRLHRRKAFAVSASVLVGLGLIPLAISPQLWSFLFFCGVGGIAFGAYISIDQAVMVAVLPNKTRRARDLGFLSVAQSSPQIIAPVIAGLLVASLGYRAVFVASMSMAVAAGICVSRIRGVR